MDILYFVIVLFATTIGALTGMGGGVIIKPSLDLLGHYDATAISTLSCVTVLVMSCVSVSKFTLSRKRPSNISLGFALPLAAGAVLGGVLGHEIFDVLTGSFDNNKIVIIQNVILGVLILAVLLYMLLKNAASHSSLPSHSLRFIPGLLSGLLLGTLSAFLGIGGGPINVAFLILFFRINTKTSVIYSLICILFAQAAQFVTIVLGSGFPAFNFEVLPFMLVAAVFGGFIGSFLNKRLPDACVRNSFLAAQALVFIICVINIVQSL